MTFVLNDDINSDVVAVDQDRGAVLRTNEAGSCGPAEYRSFFLDVDGESIEAGAYYRHLGNVFRWEIVDINPPLHMQERKPELLKLTQEGLEAYGVFGGPVDGVKVEALIKYNCPVSGRAA